MPIFLSVVPSPQAGAQKYFEIFCENLPPRKFAAERDLRTGCAFGGALQAARHTAAYSASSVATMRL
jgi:hypothetical protein